MKDPVKDRPGERATAVPVGGGLQVMAGVEQETRGKTPQGRPQEGAASRPQHAGFGGLVIPKHHPVPASGFHPPGMGVPDCLSL